MFRYFKVDLWRPCPFWEEDGQCHNRDCAVCEVEPGEIPRCWSDEERKRAVSVSPQLAGGTSIAGVHVNASTVQALSAVDLGTGDESSSISAGWQHDVRGASGLPGIDGVAAVSASDSSDHWWTPEEEQEQLPEGRSAAMRYVNLLRNPEAYTGYAGPSATRIWRAVYSENCFQHPLADMCFEERVFYRLLSGLQTSINTHIAMTFGDGTGSRADMYTRNSSVVDADAAAMAEEAEGGHADQAAPSLERLSQLVLTPGLQPHVDMYLTRIGRYPERIHNLYFAFLFLTRALSKAAPLLESLPFSTGSPAEDRAIQRLARRLVRVGTPAILAGFDESTMFVEPAVAAAAAMADVDAMTAGLDEAARGGADASCNVPRADGMRSSDINASDLVELLSRQEQGSPLPSAATVVHAGLQGKGEAASLGTTAAAVSMRVNTELRDMWRDKYRNISRIMGAYWPSRGRQPWIRSHLACSRPRPLASPQIAWAARSVGCGGSCSSWGWASP